MKTDSREILKMLSTTADIRSCPWPLHILSSVRQPCGSQTRAPSTPCSGLSLASSWLGLCRCAGEFMLPAAVLSQWLTVHSHCRMEPPWPTAAFSSVTHFCWLPSSQFPTPLPVPSGITTQVNSLHQIFVSGSASVTTSQGLPTATSSRMRQRANSPPGPLEGAQPCPHLGLSSVKQTLNF